MTFYKDQTASTDTRGAAKVLNYTEQYLRNLRMAGKGPPCYQPHEGAHWRYRYVDLDRWQTERLKNRNKS